MEASTARTYAVPADSGADAIVRALAEAGTRLMFGVPGGGPEPGRGRGRRDGRAALHPGPRRDRRGDHGRHLRRPHRHARGRGRHPGTGAGQRGQRHRACGPGPAARGGDRGYRRGRRRQPGQPPADRPGGAGPVGRQGGDHRRPTAPRRGGRADRPDGAGGAARAGDRQHGRQRSRPRRWPRSRRQRCPKRCAHRSPGRSGRPRMLHSWPGPCGGAAPGAVAGRGRHPADRRDQGGPGGPRHPGAAHLPGSRHHPGLRRRGGRAGHRGHDGVAAARRGRSHHRARRGRGRDDPGSRGTTPRGPS